MPNSFEKLAPSEAADKNKIQEEIAKYKIETGQDYVSDSGRFYKIVKLPDAENENGAFNASITIEVHESGEKTFVREVAWKKFVKKLEEGSIFPVSEEKEITEKFPGKDEKFDDELEKNLEKVREELKEARQKFLEIEEEYEKTKGLLGSIKGLFSSVDGTAIKKEYEKAKEEYEKIKMGKTFGYIKEVLEERIKLIDARVERAAKNKGWLRRGYEAFKKLGEYNLGKIIKPKSKWAQIVCRMVSVRTAISLSLLGGAMVLSGGVGALGALTARRIFSGIGAGVGSYDLMDNWARSSELKKGKMRELSKEEIKYLANEELESRIGAFEADALFSGENLKENKTYLSLIKAFRDRVENNIANNSEEYVQNKIKNIDSAQEKAYKKMGSKKNVRKTISAVIGISIGSGAVAGLFEGEEAHAHEMSADGAKAVSGKIVKEVGEGKNLSMGPDGTVGCEYNATAWYGKIQSAVGELAKINKGEGVTHALARQIESWDPEQLKLSGFAGNPENTAELHKFAINKAKEFAIDNDYIDLAKGEEIWSMDMPGYDNYYFLNSDGHIEHLYINPEGGIEGPESFTSPTESIHKLKTIDVASENTADNVSPASGAESHDFGRAEVRLIEDGRGNVSEIQTKDSFDSWDSDKKTDFLEKRVLKKEYSNILESKSHMLPGADAAAIKAGVEKWGDILIRDRQALAILSEQEGVSRQTLQALKISIEEAKKVLDDYDVLDENYVGIEDKIIMEDYIDHPVIAGGAVPDAATENIASAIKPEVFQIAGDLQAKIIKNSLGDIIGIKMLGSMDLDIMREIHNNVMSDLSYEDIASPSMQYGAEALAQKVYLYDKLLEKMSMPDSDYSQIEKILKNSLKRLPESFWDADFYDKYFD